MKLQDVIHYYIGCNMTHKDNLGASYILHFDVIQIAINHGDMPVLRRLKDMTEEEAIAVHREATKTPFRPADKDEYDVTYIKDKGEVCSIEVVDLRMPTMYTNINIKGDVLVYVHEQNQEPKICERVANQHHITHYLLTQYFDLFNLIDNGVAVDLKTIQQ